MKNTLNKIGEQEIEMALVVVKIVKAFGNGVIKIYV